MSIQESILARAIAEHERAIALKAATILTVALSQAAAEAATACLNNIRGQR